MMIDKAVSGSVWCRYLYMLITSTTPLKSTIQTSTQRPIVKMARACCTHVEMWLCDCASTWLRRACSCRIALYTLSLPWKWIYTLRDPILTLSEKLFRKLNRYTSCSISNELSSKSSWTHSWVTDEEITQRDIPQSCETQFKQALMNLGIVIQLCLEVDAPRCPLVGKATPLEAETSHNSPEN